MQKTLEFSGHSVFVYFTILAPISFSLAHLWRYIPGRWADCGIHSPHSAREPRGPAHDDAPGNEPRSWTTSFHCTPGWHCISTQSCIIASGKTHTQLMCQVSVRVLSWRTTYTQFIIYRLWNDLLCIKIKPLFIQLLWHLKITKKESKTKKQSLRRPLHAQINYHSNTAQ